MFTASDYPLGRVWPPRRAPGATRLGSRRRTRQRAPAKAWLATVAKPCSSSRSASSRCAMRSEDGSVGSGRPHAPAVHARARARAARPPPPRATRRARRAPSPAPCARAARAPRWPTRSPSRPERGRLRGVPRARLRLDHLRAAVGVELRDRPRVHEQDHADGDGHRVQQHQDDRGASIGTTWTTRRRRPRPRAYMRSRPASIRGRQWTAAVSGSANIKGSAPLSAAGDRAAEDHEVGVERAASSTCSARPSPWLTTA